MTLVRAVGATDAEYPDGLLDLVQPPDPLYVLGSLAAVAPPAVAIVGTRRATVYGERMARELARAFVRAGACVVSGLARGVDAAAHRAALAAGGRTAAVLGTGIDVPYPVGHRDLHAAIAERGVVLSENPPGFPASKGCFPKRNRILAALAQLTIVVEAGHRSGALNTATWAEELGRSVAGVPGPMDSPQSAGVNRLIATNAVLLASIDDALALMQLSPPARSSDPSFGDAERLVLEELRRSPADLDSLAARTALPARECLRAVTTLELAGAIECDLTGEIRRR